VDFPHNLIENKKAKLGVESEMLFNFFFIMNKSFTVQFEFTTCNISSISLCLGDFKSWRRMKLMAIGIPRKKMIQALY
jgi:hypothetical protein